MSSSAPQPQPTPRPSCATAELQAAVEEMQRQINGPRPLVYRPLEPGDEVQLHGPGRARLCVPMTKAELRTELLGMVREELEALLREELAEPSAPELEPADVTLEGCAVDQDDVPTRPHRNAGAFPIPEGVELGNQVRAIVDASSPSKARRIFASIAGLFR